MNFDITKDIDDIHQIKDSGKFLSYINYIKFPFYRNLKYSTAIPINAISVVRQVS
ncbi:MAG: hypothetical protein ACUZ8H_09590 [Candidatus Anammoxibacter sp.]